MKITPNIINSSLDGVPEITIRGMIDQYEDGSIARAIDECGSSKLRININSMGGSVNLGQEVIAAMQSFKNSGGIIETVNRGIAYSTAGWIFSAGTKGHRNMMPFATLMTHPPMYSDGTTLNDYNPGSEKHNILLDAMNELIDIFSPITGRTKNAIKKFMLGNSMFKASQAVKEGFADNIIAISNAVNLKDNLQPEDIINATESINYEIINTLNSEKSNTNMKEVAKLLNLNPDAAESSVLQAIKDLQNRAETSEAAVIAAKTKQEQIEAERDSLKNEIAEIKSAEIINYVDSYIGDDAGRKEKRESLINMAKSDFDTFKNVCVIGDIVNSGAQIDEGIKPDSSNSDVVGIENAKKFFNMPFSERNKLKNENPSEYRKLMNAYDNNQEKII